MGWVGQSRGADQAESQALQPQKEPAVNRLPRLKREKVFITLAYLGGVGNFVLPLVVGLVLSENPDSRWGEERPPPHLMATSILQMHAGQINALQGEVQEGHEEFIKDQLREMERLHIKEALQDQIGQYFIENRHITGKFPDYPTEKAGGSKAIFSQKTPAEIVKELAEKEKAALEKKAQKGKKDDRGKEKMKGKTPQKTEKKEGWKMSPSNFLSIMEEGSRQYKDFWQNRDKGWDFHQDHDPELNKEKREEVEEEIRVQVDELMQQKVKNLTLAVDGKKSGQKKKGRKSTKGSTESPGRKKIPEMEEDLTPDRTIDSLYRELVEKELLIKARTVKLSDYVGEYNYLGSSLRQAGVEPVPSLTDVRQLIALYGILPLGSQTVHEKAPLVKALLLAGPTGVGKKMLVHAICTETGANLFNLSASNITGKYPGKNSLQMMLHVVLKVGKQLQPSVVWIGETEKIFSKAVRKAGGEMNPSQLATILPKFLNALKAQDRVLLVGTTSRPFDADLKPFCKVYQKIIQIPRPHYGSRFVLWKHIILQNYGVITKLVNISCLAMVSDGYTQGQIVQAVQAVLSELRLLQMTRRPLRTEEFVTALATQEPVYKEEEETFKAWYNRTPLGEARIRALSGALEATLGAGAQVSAQLCRVLGGEQGAQSQHSACAQGPGATCEPFLPTPCCTTPHISFASPKYPLRPVLSR
ncbi:PREDICTED: IQ and AAA domain-containing protein 1-like, partial [Merops nubicus]|uniref:IQ and AAA domain-containing protein 1-like n=1 Tax=Merops nubicus TaxID=57421 RepID=UPI0004F0BECD